MKSSGFSIGLAAILCAFAAGVSGCGSSEPSSSDSPAETGAEKTGAAESADYEIAVVPKGMTHNFWKTVEAGARAAGDEYNAAITWIGPDQETEITRQINIINDLITKRVDAIVMAACDGNALVDVVETAIGEGIPVVTIDSGVNSDAAISFVATDNVAGAEAIGHELAELIGGEGQVGLVPFIQGAATSDQREEGFKRAMAEHENIEIASILYSNSDVAEGMSAVEDMLTRHPDLDGIFAANEPGAIGAVQAIEARNLGGVVKLVAFDASQEEIDALKRGTIQALAAQDPYRMGFKGVETAIHHLQGKDVTERIDTGVIIVTQENINDPDVQKVLNPLEDGS